MEAQLKREKKRDALNCPKVSPITCKKIRSFEVSSPTASILGKPLALAPMTRYEPSERLLTCNISCSESPIVEPIVDYDDNVALDSHVDHSLNIHNSLNNEDSTCISQPVIEPCITL